MRKRGASNRGAESDGVYTCLMAGPKHTASVVTLNPRGIASGRSYGTVLPPARC